ncbi:SDR family NAD(P)-dependent oxidoreductase [Streptomyces sp. NPDC055105]|uniref:SDR family NAD(P)-dependent oxidoreductase n=1 Tax=Streptomyces sp. NPDC055105 TaxID=3365719 RepID=UPI0037D40C15
MTGRLDGKVAFITGTAGGQGRAAALLFASEGAKIVGCDTKTAESTETAKMVAAAGGEMATIEPVDLSDRSEAQRWIDFGIDAFGRLDILYNNAGAARFAPFSIQTEEDWSFTMTNEVHLIYTVTQAAWPHLIASGNGVILNTGSLAGVVSAQTMPGAAHVAAKGAVIALTRQLAAEGAAGNIRANCISPGLIRSPATADFLADPNSPVGKNALAVPIGRVGEVEDVARAALFLASDEAGYITAVNLMVDGGVSTILP